MFKFIALISLSVAGIAAAHADADRPNFSHHQALSDRGDRRDVGDHRDGGSVGDGGSMVKGTPPMSAPEIDPASAVSAMLLLAGTVVVLRSRRKI